jgi:hypothetical protein
VTAELEIIGCFRRLLVQRNTVNRIHEGTQQRIACDHEDGERHRLGNHVGTGAGSDRGRRPQRRRGIEAAHVHALLHDDAGAEEADPRHDVGNHAHRTISTGQVHGEVDEGRRANGDQHVGAQARGALPILPLRTDQGAEHKRRGQADQRVDEIVNLEGGQKPHGPT